MRDCALDMAVKVGTGGRGSWSVMGQREASHRRQNWHQPTVIGAGQTGPLPQTSADSCPGPLPSNPAIVVGSPSLPGRLLPTFLPCCLLEQMGRHLLLECDLEKLGIA